MLNFGKFFRELFAHSRIQFINDADQYCLGFHQVIMLAFQELILLDRVDINIAQAFDLIFQTGNLFFQFSQIPDIFLTQFQSSMGRQFIFFPNIICPVLPKFF